MRIKKYELLCKSREAMMAAVQIYNNPQITFKSESFITLAIIAWTYLLHTYYANNGVDYRYFDVLSNGRKRYHRTSHGATKYWELEACLNDKACPLDKATSSNLRFLIGIRHEIEHQMTRRIDDSISAKIQSCSINYNYYIKKLFRDNFGVDQELSLAIQFSPIVAEQKDLLYKNDKLSQNVKKFISAFEEDLSADEKNDIHYAYRTVFTRVDGKRVNGETDEVITFIPADSPEAENLDAAYTLIKEKEKKKYRTMDIVQMMKNEGYTWFTQVDNTAIWKPLGSRDKYGIWITPTQWMWYENWLPEVRSYCKEWDPVVKLDSSPDSLLPNAVVKIIKEHGYLRFNSTWLTYWENENKIDRKDHKNGHYGRGGKYYWHRSIINSVLEYCRVHATRLQ